MKTIIALLLTLTIAQAETVKLGAGSYRTDLPPGPDGKARRHIEASPLVSENISGPIPTNDWWSSLVWPMHSPHSMPMFPHPIAVQANADGLGIGYTSQHTVTDHRKDGKAFQTGSDYRFPYRESLRVGLDGVETDNTLLDAHTDWSVTALWKKQADELRATFAHGSPFVYFDKKSTKPLRIKFTAAKVNANREPVAPHVIEWKNITAKNTGEPASINLSINAGSNAGIGSKARIVYDFENDGKPDRTETFQLFATDPSESTWEKYTSEKQPIDEALTRGDQRDFKNGTIRLEIWKCFGKGTIQLQEKESSLQLPDGSDRKLGTETVTIGNAPTSIATTFLKKSNALGVTLNGSHFGIFAPAGARLQIKDDAIVTDIPFLSIAALPDNSEPTFKEFESVAYAFIRDTKITYDYAPDTAKVRTSYTATTEAMQGENKDTIFALYRHQHLHIDNPKRLAHSYASPRGELRTVTGTTFTTQIPFLGVLPALPNATPETLTAALKADTKDFKFAKDDTYWNGKEFGKACELIQIAEQLGENQIRDQLLTLLKNRLEDWFDGEEKYFFYYDSQWDTLTGYPDSYGSAEQLNDHHFHYSYFIRAAATIAQYDADWCKPDRYGKMIDALIRDCANYDRDDKKFPWMRSFDPYAGHSWAAGHSGFASGNNQESSSESMNFATSLILYGQAIGDDKIRDLGIYWHSTEAEAIRQYWFDQDRKVFPDGYQQSCVGMVWGDGGSYGTWWTANPEEIHGINFLPINGGSLYLGRDPSYIERNLANLKTANRSFHNGGFEGDPENFDLWRDILAEYKALADPAAAKSLLPAIKESELGETKTHTLQWITALEKLGHYDSETQANHPTAVAFKNAYVTYNPTKKPITVKFTHGKTIAAPPGLTTHPK